MIAGTLSRYFGLRFLRSVIGSFFGVVALAAMIDYVELLRRGSDWPKASALILAEISVFRVPQLSERIMPFAVLVGAMSCYLALSRRLELVIARAAGVSAWQFVAPSMIAAFLFGTVATTIYNPLAAVMHERSKRLEAEMTGELPGLAARENTGGFWVRQRSADGAAIINAKSSREQGAQLGGVSVYTFDSDGQFKQRIEAKNATLEQGYWQFRGRPRLCRAASRRSILNTYRLGTDLTLEQARESFATPETVPFWQLPSYIELADRAGLVAAGYRLQYQQLLARPFLLTAMVLLAASVSLRFFRFGGVQKMVMGGISAGFLLFVLSKFTEDMSKSELHVADHGGVDTGTGWRSHRICRAVAPGGRIVASSVPSQCVRLTRSRPGEPRVPRSAARLRRVFFVCAGATVGPGRRQPAAFPATAAGAEGAAAAIRRADARAGGGDQIRLHEQHRIRGRQRPDLLQRHDRRSRRGHLRPKDQAVAGRGNVRMTEADGKITYGQFIDLSDDYRDGFVDSLRLETADDTRIAAARADRGQRQLHGHAKRRLYGLRAMQGRSEEAAAVADPGRADHPRPAARRCSTFEDARIEFFGVPLAYIPFMSHARSYGEAQKRLSVAEHHLQHRLRRRIRNPLFLGDGAELRFDRFDDDHDEARRVVAGNLAPATDGRLVFDQGRRHFSARPGIFCQPRRPR